MRRLAVRFLLTFRFTFRALFFKPFSEALRAFRGRLLLLRLAFARFFGRLFAVFLFAGLRFFAPFFAAAERLRFFAALVFAAFFAALDLDALVLFFLVAFFRFRFTVFLFAFFRLFLAFFRFFLRGFMNAASCAIATSFRELKVGIYALKRNPVRVSFASALDSPGRHAEPRTRHLDRPASAVRRYLWKRLVRVPPSARPLRAS